jgi:acetoacetyl-CoA synthetase
VPNWERRIVWNPPSDAGDASRMGRFLTRVSQETGEDLVDYHAAWRWSVENIEAFWDQIVTEFDVELTGGSGRTLSGDDIVGARWYEGASLNYAEHLLRTGDDDRTAIIGESQSRPRVELTFRELRDQVARAATGLRQLGVGPGDRVAAYLPNCPEAVVAFLATASVGAIWSSCAPEFGVRAVVDRFAQIGPKVFFAVTAYSYGAKRISRASDLSTILGELPTVETVVLVDFVPDPPELEDQAVGARSTVRFGDLTASPHGADSAPVPVAFDHPLYVLYSSGSTGLPKPIVHGHGGILLEHLKALGLHHDLGDADVFLWFTTTGWMMWNYLVSALALGTTIVTYDGDPMYPATDELLRVAGRCGVTVLGCGAPYLIACHAQEVELPADVDLRAIRQIGSTGSPLPPTGFEWVEQRFGGQVQVVSASGGTDLCTAFVSGAPILPVHAGEIQCRCLGAWVDAFDENGSSVVGRLGEMVIRAPMPSMPVGFWGDSDGSRYRAAYFEHFPGVWRHGDWIEITEDGTCIITGRSDATLNRGGIRSGTAEYTTIVESVPGVADSLVVHLEDSDGGAGELVLLLALEAGHRIDDGLLGAIRSAVRTELSPRHVPDRVVGVPRIPRTISGKKVEVPVKRLLSGGDPDRVVTRDALADPTAWDDLVAVVRELRDKA